MVLLIFRGVEERNAGAEPPCCKLKGTQPPFVDILGGKDFKSNIKFDFYSLSL